MAMSAMTLPEDMRRYLTRANRGELEVRVRGLQEGGRAVYAVGRQIIYTAIGLFAGFEALESWRRHELAMARDLGRRRSGLRRPRCSSLARSALLAAARVREPRDCALDLDVERPSLPTLASWPSTCSRSTRGPRARRPSSSRSASGKTLGRATTEFPQHYPQPGWVSHDAERDLGERRGERDGRPEGRRDRAASDVAAIGITNQRETTLVWDRATRRAHRPRHRLAVPAHRGRVRRAEEGRRGPSRACARRPGSSSTRTSARRRSRGCSTT